MFISGELFRLGGLADLEEMIFTHVQMEFLSHFKKFVMSLEKRDSFHHLVFKMDAAISFCCTK